MEGKLSVEDYRQVFTDCLPLITLDHEVYSELKSVGLFNHNVISTIRTQPTFSQKVTELIHFLCENVEASSSSFDTFCGVLQAKGQSPLANMLKRAVRAKITELEVHDDVEQEEDSTPEQKFQEDSTCQRTIPKR